MGINQEGQSTNPTITGVYVVDPGLYQGIPQHIIDKESNPKRQSEFQKQLASIRKQIRGLASKENILALHFPSDPVENDIVYEWGEKRDFNRMFRLECEHGHHNAQMMKYVMENFPYGAIVPLGDLSSMRVGNGTVLGDYIAASEFNFPYSGRLQVMHPVELPIPQDLDSILTNLPRLHWAIQSVRARNAEYNQARQKLSEVQADIGYAPDKS